MVIILPYVAELAGVLHRAALGPDGPARGTDEGVVRDAEVDRPNRRQVANQREVTVPCRT